MNYNQPHQRTEIMTIEISDIKTGNPEIMTFYTKGKLMDSSPFRLKPGTPDFYNFQHHFDLREGKDHEKLKGLLGDGFLSTKEINEMEEWKGIRNTELKQLKQYMMMNLINEGKFDIEGTNSKGILIKLQIRYTGKGEKNPGRGVK